MILKDKRVLITAGPTWVPIDNVRVISNIATGQTGMLAAEELNREGCKVTLLLGPVKADELRDKITKELKNKKYDIVIHSAAVSDYKLKESYRGKIKSGLTSLKLNLAPNPKIINQIKKRRPSIFLVGFKFEPKAEKAKLIKQSRLLMKNSRADLVVANTESGGKYRAYIVADKYISKPIYSKAKLVKELIKGIGDRICRN